MFSLNAACTHSWTETNMLILFEKNYKDWIILKVRSYCWLVHLGIKKKQLLVLCTSHFCDKFSVLVGRQSGEHFTNMAAWLGNTMNILRGDLKLYYADKPKSTNEQVVITEKTICQYIGYTWEYFYITCTCTNRNRIRKKPHTIKLLKVSCGCTFISLLEYGWCCVTENATVARKKCTTWESSLGGITVCVGTLMYSSECFSIQNPFGWEQITKTWKGLIKKVIPANQVMSST